MPVKWHPGLIFVVFLNLKNHLLLDLFLREIGVSKISSYNVS